MSEMLQNISVALTSWNLIAIVVGTAWGILAGALPGITGAMDLLKNNILFYFGEIV
ncbi:MAG: hypothetical protein LBQ81_09870 [Zoogloeaceae bacterium]|jgi:TctA family transporter|nr:hypothetical protein [Zoogloeaceae bacterium]